MKGVDCISILLVVGFATVVFGQNVTEHPPDCPENLPEVTLEAIRVGEFSIYLQSNQEGSHCRWTGGELNDVPVGNCFGQAVRHPVDTTEYCIHLRLVPEDIDYCFFETAKACVNVHAYSPMPSSMPSDAPTLSPTISPAPSLPPSEPPTMIPSASPSISFMPSLSKQPSASPSYGPSEIPTSQPSGSPSVSQQPSNAVVFLVSHGNEMEFLGATSLLRPEMIVEFEVAALDYFSTESPTPSDGSEVVFESVRLTDQTLFEVSKTPDNHRSGLRIVFDVAAFVLVADEEVFEYKDFVADAVGNERFLENIESIIVEENYASVDSMEKNETISSNLTVMIASLVGVSSAASALLVFLWMRRQKSATISDRENNSMEDKYMVSIRKTESYDSDTSHLAGYVHSQNWRRHSRPVSLGGLYGANSIDSPSTASEQSERNNTITLFRPSFLPTENNIEIPASPMTNYDMSQIGVDDEISAASAPSPARSDGMILNARRISESTSESVADMPRRSLLGFGTKRKYEDSSALNEDF